jgi:hypothetical protein
VGQHCPLNVLPVHLTRKTLLQLALELNNVLVAACTWHLESLMLNVGVDGISYKILKSKIMRLFKEKKKKSIDKVA